MIELISIYFQYEELSEVVSTVQNHLPRTREGVIEAINRLELQVMKYIYVICMYGYV